MTVMDMTGRRVLVAGGSRGIGRACCLEFAAAGADVAILYHANHDAAGEVARAVEGLGRRALTLRADIADAGAVEAAVGACEDTLGPLDVLVHTAGGLVAWSPVRDHDPATWARYIEVDLIGAFHTLQAVARRMHGRRSGAIVAVSSIAAQMCQPRNSQGAAAKAGLEALVRVLAREEGPAGVRVNAVAVGLTDTDMARDAARSWGQDTLDRITRGFPLGRMGRPEEIARTIRFLASDDAAYITGKVVQVDGGQVIAG